MYSHAANLSGGHPYPLLNALKLEALNTGKLDLEAVSEQLEKAEDLWRAQTQATPPTDTLWCYFDLAEMQLYRHQSDGFLASLQQGMEACDAAWQVQTFHDSLQNTLIAKGIQLDGLSEGIEVLADALRTRSWS